MREEAAKGFSTATDLAEYLVMKGVPFRESHGIVGRLVAHSIRSGKALHELTLGEYRKFYQGFDKDIFACLKVENAVNAKNSLGGTAEKIVRKRLAEIEGRSYE
jgi:argininosuccinate lyase